MATQVLTLALESGDTPIPIRDDVDGLFVTVTSNGRPIALACLPRPGDGRIAVSRAVAEAFSRAPAPPTPLASASQTRLSVIVCTHERPTDLTRCLESLGATRDAGHDVIVVDNAPSSGATAAVARELGVRVITERRKGLDHARNAGVAAAEHELVAFVDDDVVVGPGWAAAVVAAFDRDDVACVTGLVLPLELETDGQESFEQYSRQRRDLTPALHTRATLRPSAAGLVGMGANMAFRRDALTSLGGFDPRLDAGTRTQSGGDTDMFARTLDAGHVIAYVPDAFVWHRHRRTAAEVRACVFGYGVGLYSVLAKRLVEAGDVAALVTAARWFAGPVVKAAAMKLRGQSSAPWTVVLSETAGACCGPLQLILETRRGAP